MTKIEILYGVKKATWNGMNYRLALLCKNECANKVIKSILDKHYTVRTNEDSVRMNDCLKAIKFNEDLLNE